MAAIILGHKWAGPYYISFQTCTGSPVASGIGCKIAMEDDKSEIQILYMIND